MYSHPSNPKLSQVNSNLWLARLQKAISLQEKLTSTTFLVHQGSLNSNSLHNKEHKILLLLKIINHL
jgi:hypothetical protein